MKKLRKRIFAAVLAALMMVTAMPATALYASAETETVSDNAIGEYYSPWEPPVSSLRATQKFLLSEPPRTQDVVVLPLLL